MSDTQPLVGEVKSQFLLPDPEKLEERIEVVRQEQEAMCGYPLKLKGTRTTEFCDARNRRIIEVFATFEPTGEAVAQEKAENAATLAERAAG